MLFNSRLYLVVSHEACLGQDLISVTEQAIKGGVDMVQLREKKLTTLEFTQTALRLKEVLDRYSIPLIVNDNLDVARNCNSSGIHVGNNDMAPSKIKQLWPDCGTLGYSIEYLNQLENSEIDYANYLGISPVFTTPTKTDTVTQWGIEGIKEIRKRTIKPLVAIGNINESNAYEVIKSGADCIAVVSAICGAGNPAKAAWAIRNEIEKAL
ncbi:thiamine phosphate synthase [Flavobacterium sp. NRK1]|uniref:thiamine phosphate synthase n=1 Tax=Flavobacterium sp. NRK1 TaxID=2954929 RepID=UPI00209400FF|nr:thiamine phosphate synthase [Flavobacterium sp. NRK1]MCO6148286.1 thiamine phosphate synthase [Flavobacterium sp. NRK1]